ncbi:MAG: hypothetical protein H0U57_09310 [Tatlockia sp.]|nr:hypothetical protein [Tatlockia sp.]
MAKKNILYDTKKSNVDNLYSFYSEAGSKLGTLAVAPSMLFAAGGFCLGLSMVGKNAGGLVVGLMLGGIGFLLSSPISIPTFGLALLLSLPLFIVFPLALGGAALVDKLQGNEVSFLPSP